jgi:hypothetical protein
MNNVSSTIVATNVNAVLVTVASLTYGASLDISLDLDSWFKNHKYKIKTLAVLNTPRNCPKYREILQNIHYTQGKNLYLGGFRWLFFKFISQIIQQIHGFDSSCLPKFTFLIGKIFSNVFMNWGIVCVITNQQYLHGLGKPARTLWTINHWPLIMTEVQF